MSKIKIFNDPVYGFVRIPLDILFEIIEHPCFQRLRRINQLGLGYLVYPGALHTRFHHALGALHLMQEALENLKLKGIDISDEEQEAACAAILLHDIGHGPFSHGLEFTLTEGMTHEKLSELMMKQLDEEFNGRLSFAREIFSGKYSRKFLHQLVSSQLDTDRLDYLRRDSFYTGVSEGVIGSDRIIKMMTVHDNQLVVEMKGIYSIEKFLVARRLMYWQVYLHKTVVSAGELMTKIMERARELAKKGTAVPCSEPLSFFIHNTVTLGDFHTNSKVLDTFARLDDIDVLAAIKGWTMHQDKVLSKLSQMLINRDLFKIEMAEEPFSDEIISGLRKKFMTDASFSLQEASYFVFTNKISNSAYQTEGNINILFKNGEVKDIAEASDLYNISTLRETVEKYFLCYPKLLSS